MLTWLVYLFSASFKWEIFLLGTSLLVSYVAFTEGYWTKVTRYQIAVMDEIQNLVILGYSWIKNITILPLFQQVFVRVVVLLLPIRGRHCLLVQL